MLAVIFELEPREGKVEDYLAIAQSLKAELETIEGFISIERFESLARPGRYLSLSFWRDEASVERWRNLSPHRAAQNRGRAEIFTDYRLRVAQVVRDYGMSAREEAPRDSQAHHG
ncbi:antibiotic biosynthesis monooxygenase family protein [Woodsholea maritima]|uniref:antibiotic biosynthesis monooxygenase family protein n=1 Tax=Woodsholea maritima TaxID=240237 RepID=UPI00036F106A|nr:antibiotic biosynthesis monooxygenase [Woodsholea maritima]